MESYAKQRERFCWAMAREGLPFDTVQIVLKLARSHGGLCVLACNVGLSDTQEARQERLEARILEALPEGFGAVFHHDPRGATVKLTVPSGRTDDWGAVGMCVPQV